MDLEEWVKIPTLYGSEKQAIKTANIVSTTEARLLNQQSGPQYEVETRIAQIEDKWQVSWRKIFIGNKTGCSGGCQSCSSAPSPDPGKKKGKIIPFRRPSI
ncbi:MAG TPA: hypothetical protein DEF42_17220 [Desulfosporosinus sp.]|nr:hypothetical protein [Desulfosporosinus sp.]